MESGPLRKSYLKMTGCIHLVCLTTFCIIKVAQPKWIKIQCKPWRIESEMHWISKICSMVCAFILSPIRFLRVLTDSTNQHVSLLHSGWWKPLSIQPGSITHSCPNRNRCVLESFHSFHQCACSDLFESCSLNVPRSPAQRVAVESHLESCHQCTLLAVSLVWL